MAFLLEIIEKNNIFLCYSKFNHYLCEPFLKTFCLKAACSLKIRLFSSVGQST